MGAVVTIQTGLQLNNPFIPKYLIGYATRESLILEFSPTMIALILAGKVGSSIASENYWKYRINLVHLLLYQNYCFCFVFPIFSHFEYGSWYAWRIFGGNIGRYY